MPMNAPKIIQNKDLFYIIIKNTKKNSGENRKLIQYWSTKSAKYQVTK